MVEYKLFEGDCLEILPTLPDNSICGIVTDPPFSFAGGISNGRSSITDSQFFLYWWRAVCKELDRVLKQDGEGFIWCDWRTAWIIAEGFNLGQKYSWRVAQVIYHYREMPGQGQPFRSSVDLIAYVRGPKSTGHRIPNTTHNLFSKYWYYGKHENHPAEKDPEVCAQLIEWCSDPGDIILDPFMGSSATGRACAMTGRGFVGIEKDSEHFITGKKLTQRAFSLPQGTWEKPKPLPSSQMSLFERAV